MVCVKSFRGTMLVAIVLLLDFRCYCVKEYLARKNS